MVLWANPFWPIAMLLNFRVETVLWCYCLELHVVHVVLDQLMRRECVLIFSRCLWRVLLFLQKSKNVPVPENRWAQRPVSRRLQFQSRLWNVNQGYCHSFLDHRLYQVSKLIHYLAGTAKNGATVERSWVILLSCDKKNRCLNLENLQNQTVTVPLPVLVQVSFKDSALSLWQWQQWPVLYHFSRLFLNNINNYHDSGSATMIHRANWLEIIGFVDVMCVLLGAMSGVRWS